MTENSVQQIQLYVPRDENIITCGWRECDHSLHSQVIIFSSQVSCALCIRLDTIPQCHWLTGERRLATAMVQKEKKTEWKTTGSAYGPLINPPLSLRKISYKYNSMLAYIPVSFLFSFIFRVRVRVKIRLGLGWVLGIGLGLWVWEK